ncbi:hypothetical protein BGX38DRAFT_1268405 [Terfezia claveryi]|nr:hypothetical protein BGX38DRAFT_1268405 [Terfezia claveryi]
MQCPKDPCELNVDQGSRMQRPQEHCEWDVDQGSRMQRLEDPWEWDVDQVARELVLATGKNIVGKAIQLSKVDGECLLTTLTRKNLKSDVGIFAFGTRVTIMKKVEAWRKESRRYAEYMRDQDERIMRENLRDMIQEQQELERIFGPNG